MFERYTEKARRVIFFARYEASQYGSKFIETEHLLLGLLREDRQLAARFLCTPGSLEAIRNEIESQIKRGERISTSVEMPLSAECKRILNMSAEEAERLGQKHIGTEHLLLGILREENCFAARLLRQRNLALDQLRSELTTVPTPTGRAKGEDVSFASLSYLVTAWSLGSAGDFARFFAPDGQFVDPSGNLWVGPGNIHKAARLIFAAPGWARCRGKIEDVSFVGSKAITVSLLWEESEKSDRVNPACVRMTVILTQKPEGWSIARAQATGLQPQSQSAAV